MTVAYAGLGPSIFTLGRLRQFRKSKGAVVQGAPNQAKSSHRSIRIVRGIRALATKLPSDRSMVILVL